jgi:hypothetical protein
MIAAGRQAIEIIARRSGLVERLGNKVVRAGSRQRSAASMSQRSRYKSATRLARAGGKR